MAVAKTLYPGCDVWLNNPLRPLEACGTSGMKAALNGALNLSILDGWWNEWFDGRNGWAIPTADTAADETERDDAEAGALYDLIEHELVPLFYARQEGVPAGWLAMVRHTMTDLGRKVTSDRMVREYVTDLYAPAAAHAAELAADGFAGAVALAAFARRVRRAWPGVAVAGVDARGPQQARAGDALDVRADVRLNGLSSQDVAVEVVYGRSDGDGSLGPARSVHRLRPVPGGDDGMTAFAGSVPLTATGTFGYTVRVAPDHPHMVASAEWGLVAQAT
jgi:starch phosphorylase